MTREMLIGTLERLSEPCDIVVVARDAEGLTLAYVDGITLERINWLLDRAKIILHDD
jgi:hypothetical protein